MTPWVKSFRASRWVTVILPISDAGLQWRPIFSPGIASLNALCSCRATLRSSVVTRTLNSLGSIRMSPQMIDVFPTPAGPMIRPDLRACGDRFEGLKADGSVLAAVED